MQPLDIISNANVYLDGTNSLVGHAAEVDLGKLKAVFEEHEGLGMAGKLKLPTGGFEPLEIKFKWGTFNRSVLLASANPLKPSQLQVRANVMRHTAETSSTEEPLVAIVSGRFEDVPLGNYQPNKKVEFESVLHATSIKVQVGDEEILEFDAMENIYKVGGVDILADYRAELGI